MHRIPRILLALAVFLLGAAIAPSLALPSQPFSWQLFANAYGPEPVRVGISDSGFAPNVILVPTGATIRWTNNGTVAHRVTSDTGLFDSGPIDPGASWDYQFGTSGGLRLTAPGTYTYHCAFHPSMTGTIIVADQVLQVFLPVIFKTAP